MKEKIVETKICEQCTSSFEITDEDKIFYEKFSPIFGDKKYIFLLPKYCPICRRQRRLAWRNTAKLFRRKCDYSGKNILSFYDEEVNHPVYDIEIWESDKWDPLDYGRDFDFNKTFFEQFNDLKKVVPHFSRSILNFENSDYSNNASNLKNCYLCFNGGNSEDSYFTITFKNIKNCVDCYSIDDCENCYDSLDLQFCSKVFFSQDCNNCYDSYFLKNCINCKNCFGSKNLVNKEYHIFNKSFTKEEYNIEIEKLFKENSINELKNKFLIFSKQYPEKYIHGINIENAIGDYINDSKDIYNGYGIIGCENLGYCTNIRANSYNLIDVDIFGWELSNSYNSTIVGHNASRIICGVDCWENVENLFYSFMCLRNSKNLFGCIGLQNKQYCILNKQYTKQEYENLVPKIINHMIETGEWGEFFSPSISSYGYNQTEGYIFDTMDKETSLSRGFNWSDYESPFPKVEKIIPANKLPKNIKDVPDDILNWAIECEVTNKPFRIIKQELEFYRKHNLPIPKRHPDQRYLDRVALKNPRKLFDRKCDKCGIDMKTSYSLEMGKIVYCEDCYNKAVY